MNRTLLAAMAALIALTFGAAAALLIHRSNTQRIARPSAPAEILPSRTQPEKEIPQAVEPAIVAPAVEPTPEAPPAVVSPPAISPPVVIAPAVPSPAPAVNRQPPAQPVPDKGQASAPPPRRNVASAPNDAAPPNAPAEPLIPIPMAREALTLVGADPVAEEVWFHAINDPNLSNKAREDLIEDLNEEGFADPKHLTADDLPLIINRLAIIEQIAPNAMDENNYKAFMEAYKDLVNMYGKLVK